MLHDDSPENKVLQQFPNEEVKNGYEIPTLGRCKAYRVQQDGKYFIHYFDARRNRGCNLYEENHRKR